MSITTIWQFRFRPLVPHPAKGVGAPSLDGNLIVHGDNLHALKALLPLYAGKVDCVFIDPPYNTGNEGWCYNDNVNAPMIREWLDANPVGDDDGLRHDKWCAMMWPRLRLLHELLADTGLLFWATDDNEQHHARMMLDEMFGSQGFSRKRLLGQEIYALQQCQSLLLDEGPHFGLSSQRCLFSKSRSHEIRRQMRGTRTPTTTPVDRGSHRPMSIPQPRLTGPISSIPSLGPEPAKRSNIPHMLGSTHPQSTPNMFQNTACGGATTATQNILD